MVGVVSDMIMEICMLPNPSLTQARIEGFCGRGQMNQIQKKMMSRTDG